MKHILYISFYFILVNLLIFQINGKILKKSENDEIIKSNLRSGSSNSLNQIYEEKHEKKHALSHNSYDKTKNNENHKFFDKDKEVSISNLKNVSQTNVKNALRNFGVSENIFLQENKLGEEGKLINHITNDDENKEKYIKGEEENREEDPEEKAAREKQEAEEKAAREKQEAEEKAAREKQEAEEKAARERQVAEKAARERQEAEKAAREKQEAEEKAAREKQEAEEKAARERQEAEEKAAREKQEAEEKAARERQVAEKAAREKQEAEEKAAREKQEAEEKAAREKQEAEEKAARERQVAEKAARERQEAEKAAREKQEAEEKAAREKQEAEEKAAREKQEAEEKAARERQVAEKAAREKQEAEEKAAREKQEAEEKAARERQEVEKAARERQEAEEKAAREKQEAEEKAAREREEAPKRALAEQRSAFERIDSMKQKLEGEKEHGDVLAEDLYGRLEIPVIELPSENEGGYYIQHQSSLPQDNRGNSRDSKEISIIEKTNRESITTNVEGRRDIHKGHLEEKKDGSIKPEQKEDKSADVQNHALETVNILDIKDFQISEYEDEISAEYDDSLIDEEEDDEDLDQFKPIVQYDNFQDEENIGIYKELEDLIEKNENLDDLDEGIEKSSEELSEEKKKKGKKYEKTKDTNFKPNDKSLYDEHIKKYKNVKQINKEKEKFIKSLFHIFDGDNEILQIVDELSEDITKYFMKL
ncbi:liver stage antigen 1 [Plasmodium reichenowi]|uniref:Liver stage antigen 1 n=1 Tax=Plasmodium reichenowi TaxID=5854 RepID=A0A2P9DHL5_PLARE|nr:liver stage antigen 1 [Plasmodium reichenowi]